jgi:hypothetical protein
MQVHSGEVPAGEEGDEVYYEDVCVVCARLLLLLLLLLLLFLLLYSCYDIFY